MRGLLGRSAVVLFLSFGVVFAGCNQAVDPINRVQPNVVDKSIFDGEWYYLQTVIDTPYSAGYTFVGEQGNLEKITWEIQEDYLIARRSYEHIAGSEPEGIAGDTERGAAVAMFAIDKHFDVRREYNSVTGEELNVVVENDSDHPWNERRFMRVDWSKNLITNDEFLVLARLFDGIQAEPVSYYVQDLEPDDPNRPKFEYREGEDTPYYFDIVNKMFIQPTTVHIDGFGDIPSCFLLYQDHLDCAPGEITVRNSFLKVEDDDYQPMVYTGDRMDRFGYFVTERPGYDDHYGVVEPARYRFVNRHNLWQESHERTADGELVRCTASTAGTACSMEGATCDEDIGRARRWPITGSEQQGACTIPYRQREVKRIAYHVSKNFPADLYVDAEHLVGQWSSAFHDTIGSLRFNECRGAAGSAEDCAAERDRPDAATPFVLCHNPVADGDDTECGPPGTVAEIGDLRYSLIGWVSEPHLSSPLGYGPSAADPETGEIIMGNAFVYGAALETLATFGRDIVAILDGDLSESDIMDATQVQSWLDHQQAPGSEMTGRTADDHVIAIDGLDAERVNAAMDFSWVADHGTRAFGGAGHPSSAREFLDRAELAKQTLRSSGGFGNDTPLGRARLTNLVGTDIEQLLTTDEMRVAAGVDPSLPVTDGVLDIASPLRGASPSNIMALERARQSIQRESCVLGADFADDGLLGLARGIQHAATTGDGTMSWYGESYQVVGDDGHLDYEAVRTMMRHPIFDAVTAHEVGHTVGLRHNFSGSFDALNYGADYWRLRNDGAMAPRAWDPLTEAEIDGRISEYQYSTVMDYGNNFVVTDANGIGHYDRAAIKMGYGDLVEVFSNAANPGDAAWMHFMETAGWPVILKLESFTGTGSPTAYVYTDWPQVLGGIDSIQQRTDVAYTSLVADTGLQRQGISDPLVDRAGRPAVPYLFCSDEQADLNPDCQRYDRGADAYESLQSVVDTYWNYYIFNAYRRGRLGFDTDAYANRILTRYFEKLQYANQIYALYRPIFEDIWGDVPDFERFFTREDGMGAWTLGVGAAYQLLTRVVTTPEPGTYRESRRPEGTRAMTTGGAGGGSRVSAFDGRPLETTWDFDAGYFWFDQLDRAGYYYDKVLALNVLTDPETHFVGRDTAADVRRYQLSFYTTFAPSLTSFMRGVIAEDWDTISPRIIGGQLSYPDALDMETRDLPGVPVDPNASFSIQLYAATYGMALIPDTYDQTFFHMSRIFVQGGPEGVDLDASIPRVEFHDPASGLTYVAASYPDADGLETGVGAQMLLRAQALEAAGATGELRNFIDNIDVVRRLSWLLSYGG